MIRIQPQQRPHYLPTERMIILELKAAGGWSLKQTAKAFLVTPATIASWMRRLDEEGPEALVQTPVPVNHFPDYVRYVVQRLKMLCPDAGQGQDRRNARPGRITLGRNHCRTNAQTETPASIGESPLPPGEGKGEGCTAHRHGQIPWACLACGFVRGAHRRRLLDLLGAILASAVLAIRVVAWNCRGPFLQARDGLHRVQEPANFRTGPNIPGPHHGQGQE